MTFDTWGCHGGWFRWEAWVELVVGWWYPGSLLDTSRDTGECWCECWWNNWNNDFWVMLPIFLVRSLLDGKEGGIGFRCAPRKIKMEPENTPLEEESHLNQTNQGFIFFIFVPYKALYDQRVSPQNASPQGQRLYTPKKKTFVEHAFHAGVWKMCCKFPW